MSRHAADRAFARVRAWWTERRRPSERLKAAAWASIEHARAGQIVAYTGGDVLEPSRTYPKRIPRPRPGGDPDQPVIAYRIVEQRDRAGYATRWTVYAPEDVEILRAQPGDIPDPPPPSVEAS